jgi:hypothetical protein
MVPPFGSGSGSMNTAGCLKRWLIERTIFPTALNTTLCVLCRPGAWRYACGANALAAAAVSMHH